MAKLVIPSIEVPMFTSHLYKYTISSIAGSASVNVTPTQFGYNTEDEENVFVSIYRVSSGNKNAVIRAYGTTMDVYLTNVTENALSNVEVTLGVVTIPRRYYISTSG